MISLKQLFAILYAVPSFMIVVLMPIIYRYIATHGPDWIITKDCVELMLTCCAFAIILFISSMIFLCESFSK